MTQDDLNKALAETQRLNDQLFSEQLKQMEIRKELGKIYAEAGCSHIAGSSVFSEFIDIAGRTSIVWHRFRPDDFKSDVGICTVCQRVFDPEDPDYEHWRYKPSFNKLSISGVREPLDKGETVPDDQFVSGWEGTSSRQSVKTEDDILRLSPEELNKCSDFEIRTVMDYVREKRRREKGEKTGYPLAYKEIKEYLEKTDDPWLQGDGFYIQNIDFGFSPGVMAQLEGWTKEETK